MALQQLSAASRASSRNHAGTPRSGVIHVNVRHTTHFTVVGNRLAQHHELSYTARGIAVYIQSLPPGSPVGVKELAKPSSEGEARIAAALRELERHGYLERRVERLPGGQIVTRTYSYNTPEAAAYRQQRPQSPPPPLTPVPPSLLSPGREPVQVPEPEPEPKGEPGQEPELEWEPGPEPEGEPGPGSEPGPDPGLEGECGRPSPVRARVDPTAFGLLAGLCRYDPRLLLSERDVHRLAAGVSVWLERGAAPEAVALMLSRDLPDGLRSPAGVLAHRLAALVPPHLPAAPAPRPVLRPDPFQTCDGCERAFRAPGPGRCRDCPPPGAVG
ncbi:helix-turn-helix domain-containing protein [Streptomyces sp. BR123]|uniref:helix-turn-helix domain-containing protein n=1 Tax=Streptomyces sp. BR123 TaxID=2749828 RepID=UPI0015C4391B|nr:helix-turn-helix domain-containing protein [Streptomyces sp. BR123]NXY95980.1 helix-turn-helix domain-containing protein [Streptomyces sp. BR123]